MGRAESANTKIYINMQVTREKGDKETKKGRSKWFESFFRCLPCQHNPFFSTQQKAEKCKKCNKMPCPVQAVLLEAGWLGMKKNIFSVKANKATKNQKISSSTKNKHEFFTTPIKRPSLGFRGIALTGSFKGGIFIDCQF